MTTWTQHAHDCADAAKKAQEDGDFSASLALAVRAAQAAKLARLLDEPDAPTGTVVIDV